MATYVRNAFRHAFFASACGISAGIVASWAFAAFGQERVTPLLRTETVEAYRSDFEKYLSGFDNIRVQFTLTDVRRMEDGAIEESVLKGSWLSRSGVDRYSYHIGTRRNGKHGWFAIIDELVSDSGVVSWAHEGFPGSVRFADRKKPQGEKLAFEIRRNVDPRAMLFAMDRLIGHPSAVLQRLPAVQITVAPFSVEEDEPALNVGRERVAITLDEDFGWLPIRMERLDSEKPEYKFQNGAGATIEYQRTQGDTIFPLKVVVDKKLKADATGLIQRTWVVDSIELASHIATKDLQLVLPEGAAAWDLDTDEHFSLSNGSISTSQTLSGLAKEGLLNVVDRAEAAAASVDLTSAESPFFSPSVRSEGQSLGLAAGGADSTFRVVLLVLTTLAALGLGVAVVFKRFGKGLT